MRARKFFFFSVSSYTYPHLLARRHLFPPFLSLSLSSLSPSLSLSLFLLTLRIARALCKPASHRPLFFYRPLSLFFLPSFLLRSSPLSPPSQPQWRGETVRPRSTSRPRPSRPPTTPSGPPLPRYLLLSLAPSPRSFPSPFVPCSPRSPAACLPRDCGWNCLAALASAEGRHGTPVLERLQQEMSRSFLSSLSFACRAVPALCRRRALFSPAAPRLPIHPPQPRANERGTHTRTHTHTHTVLSTLHPHPLSLPRLALLPRRLRLVLHAAVAVSVLARTLLHARVCRTRARISLRVWPSVLVSHRPRNHIPCRRGLS